MRKQFWYVVINLLVITILFINWSLRSYSVDELLILEYLSLFSLITFFITNPYRLLSPYTMIILLLYIYNCGQVWLLLFGLYSLTSSFSIVNFTTSTLIESISYFLLLIHLTHLFGCLFYKRQVSAVNDAEDEDSVDYSIEKLCCNRVSWLIFLFCLVFMIPTDMKQIVIASVSGYTEAFTVGNDNSLIYLAWNIYPFSVMGLLLTEKSGRRRAIKYFVIARAIILMLLVGSRVHHMTLLCVVLITEYLLSFNPQIKRRKMKRWVIVLSVVGCILLVPTVAYIRDGGVNVLSYFIKMNPIVLLLQEMGGSLINVLLCVDYCPNVISYGYGGTYLFGVVTFFPKLISFFPQLIQYGAVGNILNPYFEKGAGLGGSLVGDLYFNFGWYSLFLTPLLGGIIAKLSNSISKLTSEKNIRSLKATVYLFLFYIFAFYTRNAMATLVAQMRYLFYALILYFIVQQIVLYKLQTVNLVKRH